MERKKFQIDKYYDKLCVHSITFRKCAVQLLSSEEIVIDGVRSGQDEGKSLTLVHVVVVVGGLKNHTVHIPNIFLQVWTSHEVNKQGSPKSLKETE